ncbi:MAG: helix-turn-helix transcriptional regulator [Cyclobacteriaceae bacterium]|tara:strand:+ start:570 stop:824 length:255 start_codon:yes stop_codon:yes gene_type:complete
MSSNKTEKSEYSNIPKEFGKVLAILRKEKGMTQYDLVASSGLSLRMISDMERGLIQPSLITLFKLAKGLNISILDLIKRLLESM